MRGVAVENFGKLAEAAFVQDFFRAAEITFRCRNRFRRKFPSRRERLAKDPDWQKYLQKVIPLLVKQENRLLKPTEFSPIR